MPQVSVRVTEMSKSSSSALQNLSGVSESIRNRAYELFQQRGSTNGSDMSDWLQAERELFTLPPCELSESSREYTLQLSVPGMEAANIEVSSTENSIIVTGSSSRGSSSSGSSSIRFSEMSSKPMLRRIELPSSINAGKVTATLESGMLTITAPKSSGSGRSSAAGA